MKTVLKITLAVAFLLGGAAVVGNAVDNSVNLSTSDPGGGR